jgi:hypothetical protein
MRQKLPEFRVENKVYLFATHVRKMIRERREKDTLRQ